MKVTRRKFLTGAFAGISAILLSDALLYEPRILISVEKLEVSGSVEERFRIVQISDIHLGNVTPIWNALSVIKRLKPDVVVVTGDVFSSPEKLDEGVELVEELSDLAPTLIVYGNWDYWSGVDLEEFEVRVGSNAKDAKILKNSYVMMNRVCFAGVDDPYTGRDVLEKAISIREGFKGFTVLLAHSPQIIGKAEGRVDLVLSGHTHGGQVTIPGIGPLYVPLPKEYRKYKSGLYKVGNTLLYVNRGIGTSVFPARFACPPEVTLISLHPGD
ncbi:MAG: metallophosphoesterase [Archaeoglobus sp.]|nr:metallophosphoesterase [Archaeoglobus sp.]